MVATQDALFGTHESDGMACILLALLLDNFYMDIQLLFCSCMVGMLMSHYDLLLVHLYFWGIHALLSYPSCQTCRRIFGIFLDIFYINI